MAILKDSTEVLLQDSIDEQLYDSLVSENVILVSVSLEGSSEKNIILSGEAKTVIHLSGNISKHEE